METVQTTATQTAAQTVAQASELTKLSLELGVWFARAVVLTLVAAVAYFLKRTAHELDECKKLGYENKAGLQLVEQKVTGVEKDVDRLELRDVARGKGD